MIAEDQAIVTAEIKIYDEEIGKSNRRLCRSLKGWRV